MISHICSRVSGSSSTYRRDIPESSMSGFGILHLDSELCSVSGIANRQAAPHIGLDDGPGHVKADPGPLLRTLGGKVWFEQPVYDLAVDAAGPVGNGYDRFASSRKRVDANNGVFEIMPCQRVAGVHQYIQ